MDGSPFGPRSDRGWRSRSWKNRCVARDCSPPGGHWVGDWVPARCASKRARTLARNYFGYVVEVAHDAGVEDRILLGGSHPLQLLHGPDPLRHHPIVAGALMRVLVPAGHLVMADGDAIVTTSSPLAWVSGCFVVVVGDGRPVYGMGGLDGLGGRIGGQETTSADWDGLGGREPQPCQGEGRGFESRRPLH